MSDTLTRTESDSGELPAGGSTPTADGLPTIAADPDRTSFADPAADVEAAEAEAARIGEFAEQLVGMLGSATTLFTIELGRRFGLYRALHERGALNPAELAVATGIAPRYAREWLEQQAAAGLLEAETDAEIETESSAADARSFSLPAHHVPGLVEELHPGHVAPAAGVLAGVALAFPAVVADFTHGRGVAFDAYGTELRQGLGALNRPGFHHAMRDWVHALPDRAAVLERGGAVLDAGCGTGWSTIALATAFPNARVVGLDLDVASIAEAREHAAAVGIADRVAFLVGDAADADAVRAAAAAIDAPAGFDLVTVFEALHDMGMPARALSAFREALADGGALLVADERVADEFAPNADPVERMLYAMSVLHCLPATTAESHGIANGTVLRAPTLRRWAGEAGFARLDVLGIENPFWRFYRIG